MKETSDWRRNILFISGSVAAIVIAFCAGRFSVQTNNAAIETVTGQQIVAIDNVAAVKKISNKVISATTAPGEWDITEWERLLSQPATPGRNAALAALLEKFAATDHDRAMAMANAEANLTLRKELTQAVLHGWARTAPLDAANWALALPNSSDRDAALKTVFSGAIATSPESAVATGRLLMQQNPAEAVGCGSRLIDALCESGDFGAAAELATTSDSRQRNFLLGQAFSKWASFQPEAAAQAAQAISDPAIRNQALHGIVGGWAEADPAGLVQFLAQLPAGNDRGQMLGQALKSWVQTDSVAAANWINGNNQFGADLNEGAAQVAAMESLPVETAMAWAESITDPQLRSTSVASVLRDWIYEDPIDAQVYFQTTKNLLPADRQQLSEVLTETMRISMVQ